MPTADPPPPDQEAPRHLGGERAAPVEEPWPVGPPASPGLIRLDLWGTGGVHGAERGRRRRGHAGHRVPGRHLRRRPGGRGLHRLRMGLCDRGRPQPLRRDRPRRALLPQPQRAAAARRPLLGLLVVQIVVGVGAAAIRPFTVLAFCVLAPLFGLGLITLWSARNCRFPPRGHPAAAGHPTSPGPRPRRGRRRGAPTRGRPDLVGCRPPARARTVQLLATDRPEWPRPSEAVDAAPPTGDRQTLCRMHATEQTTIAWTPRRSVPCSSTSPRYPGVGARPEGGRGLGTDDEGRATAVRFRAAAMGRSTTYTPAVRLPSDDVIAWRWSRATSCARSTALHAHAERDPTAPTSTTSWRSTSMLPLPGFVKRRAESDHARRPARAEGPGRAAARA